MEEKEKEFKKCSCCKTNQWCSFTFTPEDIEYEETTGKKKSWICDECFKSLEDDI